MNVTDEMVAVAQQEIFCHNGYEMGSGFLSQEAVRAALEAAIALMRGQSEWMQIESEPDDHMPRLYLCRGRVVQGFVDATGVRHVQHELGWRQMRREPTHWRPLISIPAKTSQEPAE